MLVVLATANPHKMSEIEEIIRECAGDKIHLVPRPNGVAEVDEIGETLADNARLKAETICVASGEISVADDTGLFVDALGGAPGVHSARYAGKEADAQKNLAKLLLEMEGIANRRAVFRTVALARFPDGRELVSTGEVVGKIATRPRGLEGFGYDPVFIPDETAPRTFAELSAKEKHAISHRGRAFRALCNALSQSIGLD